MQSRVETYKSSKEFSLIKGQEELLNGLRKGKRSTQLSFYKRFAPAMMKICMRYCNSREDAIEVLNDAFLSIFQSIPNYKPTGSLVAWMSTIVRRKAIDHLRRRKVLFVEFDYKAESETRIEPEAINAVNFNHLLSLIQKLPNASKIVFNLFVFESLKHAEIAKELGISINTSKWHLSNARKIIQEKLKSTL